MAGSSVWRTNLCRECGPKRPQQIARVRLGAEQARVLLDRNDGGHRQAGVVRIERSAMRGHVGDIVQDFAAARSGAEAIAAAERFK